MVIQFKKLKKKIVTLNRVFSIALTISAVASCNSTTTNLDIEDAKKTIIDLKIINFTPPPRHINDILSILDDSGHSNQDRLARLKRRVKVEPSPNMNPFDLSEFYKERAKAKSMLSRMKQSRQDLRLSVEYANKAGVDDSFLLESLAQAEMRAGNFNTAIDLLHKAIDIEKPTMKFDWNAFYYWHLARIYQNMGDFNAAARFNKKANKIYDSMPEIIRMALPKFQMNKVLTDAELLELKGDYSEAQVFRHMYLNQSYKDRRKRPLEAVRARRFLSLNLKEQGRLFEAELQARKAVKEAIRLTGKNSSFCASSLDALGEILLAQGRIDDAVLISSQRIFILQKLGVLSNEDLMVKARIFAGDVMFAKFQYKNALKEYDLAYNGSLQNRYFYKKYVSQNPNIIITYIKNGELTKAEKLIQSARLIYDPFLIANNYKSAEMLAIQGLIHAANGYDEKAFEIYEKAVPVLIKQKRYGLKDLTKERRFRVIIEDYMGLLNHITATYSEKEFKVNTLEENFKLAQAIIQNKVGMAIDENSARAAAVKFSGLSDLAIKEQSANKQLQALKEMLFGVIAAPKGQQNTKAIESLKRKINALENARTVILKEINRKFPEYSNLKNPELSSLEAIQGLLNAHEAMLMIYCGTDKTYVWAIPKEGKVAFSHVDITKNEIREIVSNLRESLDPQPYTFGDIPKFDVKQSYDLYKKILKPVEAGWIGSRDLLIIASGPLGQMPFSILPTASVKLKHDRGELFSSYRKIPWLIRKVSISRLPSVSSLITLRTIPKGDPNRKAFAGFGDPLFNREHLTYTEGAEKEKATMRVRGIRLSDKGNLDDKDILSTQLERLNRLTDTAEEIISIANALGADPAVDVFLGKHASEQQVKTMDLSDRKVIAFASHGLVPGDLDGLDQPAIALSSPSVTGGDEDGLLKMGEILQLRLNADWIVLSACNTGASDGSGSEAVSGLGRAFFYAGSRALLVSMWPVETTSAKNLTTTLFNYQRQDKNLTRARALQKSMLNLLDKQSLKDDKTGKNIVSYAHPIFWAPFIIVGDGR